METRLLLALADTKPSPKVHIEATGLSLDAWLLGVVIKRDGTMRAVVETSDGRVADVLPIYLSQPEEPPQ